MDLFNLKLPYINEVIKFGTYHNLSVNGWFCELTTFRDSTLKYPYEKIIGIQWHNTKLNMYKSHEEALQMFFCL